MEDPWETLLETARKVHLANSKLQDFCPFPKDIKKQEFDAFHIPASDLMQNETGLLTDDYAELRDTFLRQGDGATGNKNLLAYTRPRRGFFHFEKGFQVQLNHNSQIR